MVSRCHSNMGDLSDSSCRTSTRGSHVSSFGACSSRKRTSPGSGRSAATTTTAIRGGSSATAGGEATTRRKDQISRLYEYLDRVLSPAEEVLVQQHLEICEDCVRHFQFEERLLATIWETCRTGRAP